MDKLRVVNQIKPKYRKWTPEITGRIDRDKCDRIVIGPYDHEPLQMVHEIVAISDPEPTQGCK